MNNFMIRFFICNVFICVIIGILLFVKRIFKGSLTSRMQYNLWFFLLFLLVTPFIPFQPVKLTKFISPLNFFSKKTVENVYVIRKENHVYPMSEATNLIDDFAVSAIKKTHFLTGYLLFVIWLVGISLMLLLVIKSIFRLKTIKDSALPLQNKEVGKLYKACLTELSIKKNIPIYSTAFLSSPIVVGFIKPAIYFPIHLISENRLKDIRYMLLHELQHYKHKDTLVSYLMELFGILYWFNPCVWYALKEMRNDREIACDTSVLKILEESDYECYGNTLINLAEKISFNQLPFTAKLVGNMEQIQRRIINIASYKSPSGREKKRGVFTFIIIAFFLLNLAPLLSTYASENNYYQWKTQGENVIYNDFSAYFHNYEGCFVMYDLSDKQWHIYDVDNACLRVSPNSTYKIYDALFGLENEIITPEYSLIEWNGQTYPFESWNKDHTLASAMQASVNWYFQSIDEQLGFSNLNSYIHKIGYGNENITGGLSSYWMEASLKISALEQVELLKKLYHNNFYFSLENINAVKNSILISSSDNGNFYGKTGTGRINDKDVNGWFIGYIETSANTYFFATNIHADKGATGSNAVKITMSILSDMNIWK